MDKAEWNKELQKYTTPRQTAIECIEGLEDHLRECTTGHTQTVVTHGPQPRPPFKEEPTVCDRGTRGCDLVHNDVLALKFALMGFKHIKKLTENKS